MLQLYKVVHRYMAREVQTLWTQSQTRIPLKSMQWPRPWPELKAAPNDGPKPYFLGSGTLGIWDPYISKYNRKDRSEKG